VVVPDRVSIIANTTDTALGWTIFDVDMETGNMFYEHKYAQPPSLVVCRQSYMYILSRLVVVSDNVHCVTINCTNVL